MDASLGSQKHVGFISVGTGSICPGAGVHKSLPPVGDIFITGILNVSGTFEHFLLQTTRLSSVVQMAEIITAGIEETFAYPYEKRRLLPDTWFQPEESDRRLCWANDTGFAALSIESSSGIISLMASALGILANTCFMSHAAGRPQNLFFKTWE